MRPCLPARRKSSAGRQRVSEMEMSATQRIPESRWSGSSTRMREERNAPAADAPCWMEDCKDMKRARSRGPGTREVSVL